MDRLHRSLESHISELNWELSQTKAKLHDAEATILELRTQRGELEQSRQEAVARRLQAEVRFEFPTHPFAWLFQSRPARTQEQLLTYLDQDQKTAARADERCLAGSDPPPDLHVLPAASNSRERWPSCASRWCKRPWRRSAPTPLTRAPSCSAIVQATEGAELLAQMQELVKGGASLLCSRVPHISHRGDDAGLEGENTSAVDSIQAMLLSTTHPCPQF